MNKNKETVVPKTDALSRLQSAGRYALELEAVNRHFGALVALADINLTVKAGERRAVLGSNGAGKTTLFNAITGDFQPTTGSVRMFGEDVTNFPVHERIRRGLRRTYQISLLFAGLTVLETVFIACRGVQRGRFSLRHKTANDGSMETAKSLLQAVHLTSLQLVKTSELSYGEQRQLEIALALAGAPRLILFDEPAAGLSPKERTELVEILQNLPEHISFIIIEHDMDVALKVVESVTMMHNGRIIKEGTPEAIEEDPEIQKIYLGEG